MKFYCRVDGVHFKTEFKDTFIPPCNFWGDLGMSTIPMDLKKKFWDWLFSMPTDEIGETAKIAIGVSFTTGPISDENAFKEKVPHYDDWSEKEQQEFQRKFFKAVNRGENMDKWLAKFIEEKKSQKPERLMN